MSTSQPHTDDATPASTDGPIYVVGGGPVGRSVADHLTERDERVTYVDRSPPTDPPPGQSVHGVDSLTADDLDDAGLGDAAAVLVLEPEDATNLLVAQIARTRFGVDRVLVRVNDPERASAYDGVDVETIDATTAFSRTVTEQW